MSYEDRYDAVDFYCETCEKETMHTRDSEMHFEGDYVCEECHTLIVLDKNYKRIF